MAKYIVTTQSSNLNVRKEPNTTCAIIGKLAKGTEIEVAKIENGWATISFNDQTAYVSADYITVSKSALDDLKF
ncbi:MAG: SH3 domain-containing protein [Paludibacteraceae bacterium]|nr:SH3 domain-containing protein [Paludibacteraceae bacterium]